VDRTFPFTIGITTLQATICLLRRGGRIEFTVDLAIFLDPDINPFLFRIDALDL
jgi:hypothetical protein